MGGREVELIDYLRVLRRQKWIIAATLITAVVVAWAASRAIAPTYQTETSLLLLPPLSSQLEAETVGSRLGAEAYAELAVSTGLLELVKQKADLQDSTTITSLKKRFSVSVDRLSSAGEFLMRASVKGSDPERLPTIATAWTEAFAERYGELFQDRIARSYEYVRQNYAETESELERLVEERTNLLLEHPVSVLQSDLAAVQLEERTNRAQLADARRTYQMSTAELAALEVELAGQPLVYSLTRSISPDSLVAALGVGLTAREIEALMDVQAEDEQLNDTYVNLNTQTSTLRASLRALEEEIRVREENSTALRIELEAMQRELTETEANRDDLDRRVTLLQTGYTRLAADLQSARIALAETPEPIRVIDEPLVPSYPIAPRKTTNIAVAGFLGLMLGTLFALFVDYLARVREQEGAPPRSMGEAGSSDEPRHKESDEKAQSGRANNGKESPPQHDGVDPSGLP